MGLGAQYKLGFYYSQLNIDQQFDYKKAAQAISHYDNEVCVKTDDAGKLHQMLMAVKYDNPEFCYWSLDGSEAEAGVLKLCYLTEDENEAVELIQMLRDKRKSILGDLCEGLDTMTQKAALKVLFDYLADNITYAEDELQKPTCSPWIYDISGILLEEKGVCLGIAMAMNYFCQALRIPSILITGEAKVMGWTGNHGWNMVRLDNEYYHLDATSALELEKTERDRYYLVKDKDMADRSWPKALYPKAV